MAIPTSHQLRNAHTIRLTVRRGIRIQGEGVTLSLVKTSKDFSTRVSVLVLARAERSAVRRNRLRRVLSEVLIRNLPLVGYDAVLRVIQKPSKEGVFVRKIKDLLVQHI